MRRLTVLAVGLVTGLALVGCSSQTTGTPTTAGSGGENSSGLVKHASMAELAEAADRQFKADQTIRLTLRSQLPTGGAITGDGSIRVDGAGVATKIQMSLPTGAGQAQQIEMIVLPPADAYVKLPAGLSPTQGKPWFKVDPDGTDPISKAMAPSLSQLQNTTAPLSYLQKVGQATIVDVAEDTVDGTKALRYKLRVDLSNSTDESAADLRAAGIKTLEPEVWLGEKDRLVRFKLDVAIPGAGAVETDARYREWGKPVDIAAPPPDQVGTAGG